MKIINTQSESTTKTSFSIGGMSCSGCATTVQEALSSIDGVWDANADLENKSASVTYNADAVSIDDLKQAVEDAGYEFKGEK